MSVRSALHDDDCVRRWTMASATSKKLKEWEQKIADSPDSGNYKINHCCVQFCDSHELRHNFHVVESLNCKYIRLHYPQGKEEYICDRHDTFKVTTM